jgi:glycosyltransferase involved in cell wall biosynthesis
VRVLAPYLAEHGWKVSVYGRSASVVATETPEDVESILTPGLEKKSLSTLTYGLTSTIHTAVRRPNAALVLNVANGFWLPLLRARGIPTVVNVDGIEWERAKWGRGAKAVFKAGAHMTARFADTVVVDSHEIGKRWSSEFGRQGSYIPYGGTRPPALEPEACLEKGKYIVMVARFVPENTVEEFFEAAKVLSERWQVVIVGSSGYGGPIEERLRQLVEVSDNIRWYGHVSDDDVLFSLWQHAAVYFHGHSVGGTNPALVQAMACGVATVARDTTYNREVLGDAGCYVDPTPPSIIEGVSSLMLDPAKRQRVSRLALLRTDSVYNWDYVCSRYERMLSGAVERDYSVLDA